MKCITGSKTLWLVLLALTITACTADEEEQTAELLLEATASAPQFVEAEPAASRSTRSWEPPTSYYLYDALNTGSNYTNLTNKTIDAFFTRGNSKNLHGRLRYVSSNGTWKLVLPNTIKVDTISQAPYYIYGFIPRDAADGATISLLEGETSYAAGAVLTIQGLQTVAADPCVIIGAQEGYQDGEEGSKVEHDAEFNSGTSTYDNSNRVAAGNFRFFLRKGTQESPVNNYLFLLFDHLYSSLCLGFKVNAEYNALRTIKLKEIHLQPFIGDDPVAKKTNVTITLRANDTGTNPVTDGNIVFDQTGYEASDGLTDGLAYRNTDGVALTTTESRFLSNFMASGVTKLNMTCTYDVYDKNVTAEHPDGNLIRKDCKATNKLVLSELFSGQNEARRGTKYIVHITIRPTYLYMLSEPDLDNPVIEVES